ncbi:cyclic nucleotide-binding domain-containing protein [Enterococcus canintestini]|uniref:cyclic nucleotide-binding domain-containing protein n=1 Tax=Enterococcus canintestini TaxID=317010 RepID=UPI000900497A|nr:cyclic nucleotide-binding domain-containing protein [Enterococcus canintestini]
MQKKLLGAKQEQILTEWNLAKDCLRGCEVWQFDQRETIITQGGLFDRLLIVLAGKAKVCTLADNGKNLVLAYYISDGIIGDMEFAMNKDEAATTMVALSNFQCIALPILPNETYLRQNTLFLNQMAKGLAEKLLLSSENFLSAAFYPGKQRLCGYILQSAYKNFFTDNLTDVAATIGMSYRHMFRLLNDLITDGILLKVAGGYEIIQPVQLKQFANGYLS